MMVCSNQIDVMECIVQETLKLRESLPVDMLKNFLTTTDKMYR